MIISIIVAIAQNGVIGKQNQLPWHLPNDLKYFKRITSGHAIIMGRKTYESIGKPLPNRRNYVISSNASFQAPGCYVFSTIEAAISHCRQNNELECFIIGGAALFSASVYLAQRYYLTTVEATVDGDVFLDFPDPRVWKLASEELHKADEQHAYNYNFCMYERER